MEINQEIMESEDACFLFPESKDLKIILADNHDTRLSELNKIGLHPRRVPSHFEPEKFTKPYTGEAVARRISEGKVRDVADHLFEMKEHYDIIMGFHTVIIVDGEHVGRISTREKAFTILKILNNRSHSVVTGVTLLHSTQKCETFHVETKVEFGDIPQEMFVKYLESGKWTKGLTTYSTNNESASFIKAIDGCPINIMGVPTSELVKRIKKLLIDGKKIRETDKKENVDFQQQICAKEKKDDNDTKKNDVESNIGKEIKLNASGDEKAKKPIPPPQAVAPMLQKKSEAVIKDGSSKHPYSDEEFDFLKQYIRPAVNSSNNVVDDAKKDDGEKFREMKNIDSVNVVVPSTTENPAVELNDEYGNKPAETHEGQYGENQRGLSYRPPQRMNYENSNNYNRCGMNYGNNNYRYTNNRGRNNRKNNSPPDLQPPGPDDDGRDSDHSILIDTPTVHDDVPISTKTIPVVPVLNVAKPDAPILNGTETTPAALVKGRFYTKVVKTYN